MGTGFAKRKKQAKMMQEQFKLMQEKIKDIEVVGQAANGLVNITMNGDGDVTKVRIKPECVDKEDVEGLEDLIRVAFHDAKEKVKKESSQGMPALPGGMEGMPGLGF